MTERILTLATRLILGALVCAVFIGLGYVTMLQLADTADRWNGVPACTNEIADAGGICHGEPTD